MLLRDENQLEKQDFYSRLFELIIEFMDLEPQTKRKIRELLNASIARICHKYREPSEAMMNKNYIELQNIAREEIERIMQRTDAFLDDEKIALRSEEFIALLFDDFYSRLKELGILPPPATSQDPSEYRF